MRVAACIKANRRCKKRCQAFSPAERKEEAHQTPTPLVSWNLISLSLHVRSLQNHNAGAYRDTLIEIGNLRVGEPETSRRHRRPDRPGLVGAVNR